MRIYCNTCCQKLEQEDLEIVFFGHLLRSVSGDEIEGDAMFVPTEYEVNHKKFGCTDVEYPEELDALIEEYMIGA